MCIKESVTWLGDTGGIFNTRVDHREVLTWGFHRLLLTFCGVCCHEG